MKIKDIARLAKVSPATVSRVINNSGYVKEEKKKAVKKVIEEVNYTPNEFAKSLKTQKSNIIGVIVPKISTETVSRVVDGITMISKENNYQLLIANTNLQVEEELNYLKVFSNNLVDGIIIMATVVTDEHLRILNNLNKPVVFVGQRVEKYTSIVHDDYNAAKAMAQHLIEKGHEKIAFVGVSEKDVAVGKVRKQAYFDALTEHNITIDKNLIAIGDFSLESGYKAMGEILQKGQPSAVMAVTDQMAFGAIHCIKDNKLSVPEDISVTGIGDGKMSKYFIPALTTAKYHHKKVGKLACEHLMSLINSKGKNTSDIVVGYDVKLRSSVNSIRES
ncbi:LacI family DNA-binding transcriptional regulator [Proteinivorax hydrogeniformans]|uniref:LacI family DNA-binding transcriptional regulator n=1 Tax=Proteinivorax hydrogeniformans TaxID=1826727 RepID=A0AAU8HTF9_9FIRM